MTRGGGLFSIVCVLVIVGALVALQARQAGPTSSEIKRAEAKAQQASALASFTQATTALEAYRAANATYAGATLDASLGVTLVRADAGSYCVQLGSGAAMQHENGPAGTPAAGGC